MKDIQKMLKNKTIYAEIDELGWISIHKQYIWKCAWKYEESIKLEGAKEIWSKADQ